MKLDCTSLKNAVESLEIALDEFEKTHNVFVKEYSAL